MRTDQNRETIRRYYQEVLNGGNTALLDQLAVPDYVEHNPLPGQAKEREGLKQRVDMLKAAFAPNFTVEDVIAEGDRVVVRWTNRGTHVREFFGIPPTGKTVVITGIDIHRLQDGKMAEHWHNVDELGMLQQIGAIPMPEPAGA